MNYNDNNGIDMGVVYSSGPVDESGIRFTDDQDQGTGYSEVGIPETEKEKKPRSFKRKAGLVAISFGFIAVIVMVGMTILIGFGQGAVNYDSFYNSLKAIIDSIDDNAVTDVEFFSMLAGAVLALLMVAYLIVCICKFSFAVRHEEKVNSCIKSMVTMYFIYIALILVLSVLNCDDNRHMTRYTILAIASSGILTIICYSIGMSINVDNQFKKGNGGRNACAVIAVILAAAAVVVLSSASVGTKIDGEVSLQALYKSAILYEEDPDLLPFIYYVVAFLFSMVTVICACAFVNDTFKSWGTSNPKRQTVSLGTCITLMVLCAISCVASCLHTSESIENGYYVVNIVGSAVLMIAYALGIIAWDLKRRQYKAENADYSTLPVEDEIVDSDFE